MAQALYYLLVTIKKTHQPQVEKAVRVPAPPEKAESAVEKSKELVAETKPAEKAAEKNRKHRS